MLTLRSRLVRDDLPALEGEIRRRAGEIVRKAAHDVEGRAKARVPIRTGALMNSIQARQESDLSAIVAAGMHYAAFVEFGTHRRRPRPYMGPAAEDVRPSFEAAFRQLLRR